MEPKETIIIEEDDAQDNDTEWSMLGCSFTPIVEVAFKFFFFNYWCASNEFPPFDGCHERLHDWIPDGETCVGSKRLKVVYNQCKENIC